MLPRIILRGTLYSGTGIGSPRHRWHRQNSSRPGNSSQDVHPLVSNYSAIQAPQFIHQHKRKFEEGRHYHGFVCVRSEHVSEFSITSYTFRHIVTGTELWYLDRNDVNNVFSVNFRTTPFDSTGLPHILEHSVLCGSQKYPVRDPFFKMLNRSVATFMNAMTGPDYTMYPFSSMNETDYRNLQRIYLDAVFRPNLKYIDFLQEGWRLEHVNVHDQESEYVLKGVVYNEMKGAFSENASIFGQNLLNNLLPYHTYGFVSGGNPLEIPKLTHKNVVEFHRKYYHPSNARIYTYGTFDLNKTLEYVNEDYLSRFDHVDNSFSRIPNQPRWSQPRNVHISSRYDTMGASFDKQNQIAIALLMADVTNLQETFVLYVLSELLVRGPNSAFYKSFIEPNFSGGYNQTTGYDPQIKDTFFCVGLQDVRVEDFGRVQQLFDATIQQVIDDGFEQRHIESVLHNIELSLRHQSPQFGLGLLFNSTPLWNHDGDVVENLHVSSMIANFRQQLLENRHFLEQKVEQYFASNTHRLTLTMSPDDNYEDNFKTAELDLLKQKIIALDHVDRQRIFEDGKRLEEAQKSPPYVDVLPCLKLADVQADPKLQTLELVRSLSVPTQLCKIQTNAISYMKCYFDGVSLTREETLLLPLFCNIISDMGTSRHDYREFDKLILHKTSGIDFKLHFAENIYDGRTYDVGVMMTIHALDKNTAEMFNLCRELLVDFQLGDLERLSMIIDSYVSSISVGVANAGHLHAMQSCAGLVTDSAKLKAELGGLEHIELMKQYVGGHSTQKIQKRLQVIGQKLFNRQTLRVALNTSDEFYPTLENNYKRFLEDLPLTPVASTNAKNATVKNPEPRTVNLLPPSCQHFVMNIPVNYCAKAFFTVPYTHQDHPVLRLLAKLLSAKYLLPVVREQNGAYGAGARIGSEGIFSFFSYRDPNCNKTLDAFDHSYDWLHQNADALTEQTLFEAKLGVLQQLDAPVAPGNIGIDYFLYGVSHEMFLKYRERMLVVTLPELQAAIELYLRDPPEHHGKCVLGPENKELSNRHKDDGHGTMWKIIT